MFHDKDLKASAGRRPAIAETSALAAVTCICDIGVESVILSRKLFDNSQKLCRSVPTHKDAKDASRALGAFVNASYRDMSENAGAVLGIWRRYIRGAYTHGNSF